MAIPGLDDVDNRIIEILRKNARMSYSDIGHAIGKSRVAVKARIVLRLPRILWEKEIGEFHLSHYAEDRLRDCGISRVRDLYATHPKREPGWYAVRELFRKIEENEKI